LVTCLLMPSVNFLNGQSDRWSSGHRQKKLIGTKPNINSYVYGMALIYSVDLLTDRLLQSQNTNKTHIIPDQFLFGSGSGGQSHSLTKSTMTNNTSRASCPFLTITTLPASKSRPVVLQHFVNALCQCSITIHQ
jgi:hypothetical protein